MDCTNVAPVGITHTGKLSSPSLATSGLYQPYYRLASSMWEFQRLRMKKYLNYQPLSATTDDERAGGSLSSSTFAAVGNGLEGGDDDRMIVSLSFLCFSICLFFLSVVFYSERSMSRITDKRCMYRMSAPSTTEP